MESLCGVLGFLLLTAGLPLQAAKRESRPLWALTLVNPNDEPGPSTGVGGGGPTGVGGRQTGSVPNARTVFFA